MSKISKSDTITSTSRSLIAELGIRIDEIRRTRSETGEQFAQRLGISRSTYSRLISGDVGVSIGTYVEAIVALGLADQINDLCRIERDQILMARLKKNIPKKVMPVSEEDF